MPFTDKKYFLSFPLRAWKILSVVVFFISSPDLLVSQTDYEFWFAAPEIISEYIPPSPVIYTDLDKPIKLIVTTTEGPAIFTIAQPANPAFQPISDVVQTDVPKEIDLTSWIDIIENKPADTVLNYGIRITSDKPVSVKYEIQNNYKSDTYSLKGRNALGFEFIIPSQDLYKNTIIRLKSDSAFLIC